MLFTTNKDFTITYPLKEADVVFMGIPFSYGSLSSHSNYGPLMIRESLKLMEDYTEKGNIFEKLKICDVGDVEIVSGSYKKTRKKIMEAIDDIKKHGNNPFPVIMGGNHLITLPVCKALKPKTIVQLDAHADMRPNYKNSKYMQQTWAYHCHKKGMKFVQIGVRSKNKQEIDYLENNKGGGDLDNLESPVHLTIDMDVFDPAYVETGLPEPNGLTPEDVMQILNRINPDSMDVTEISDNKLPSKTGFLAGRCIIKVLNNKIQ